ncbi:MAG: sugar phosphate isomerase/epimerase [Chloroflexota bacterium]
MAKLAAQLYTVREFTQTAAELGRTLEQVREIGYTAVQVSAIGAGIAHKEVKRLADVNGLTICNTHVGFEALRGDLTAVIDQHRLWDCRHVAIGSMPRSYRDIGEMGYRRFAADVNRIGEQLHAADLTFSYHNHSFEFVRFGNQTGLDLIYADTEPRFVQAEIDTYWVQHGGGDPAAWIARMKGRMPVVHLKDMVILAGTQAMAEVGEGNLNWPAILAACEEAGVEWYAVEQDICQRNPFESLAISYRNLRGMGVEA